MELGNMLFGNSRGKYPIEDRETYQNIFWKYFDPFFDYHMYPLAGGGREYEGEFLTELGGYENDVFMANPYYWGEDEEIAERPNFIYKPKGIEISWYKYPLRDAYWNVEMTPEEFDAMCRACVKSMADNNIARRGFSE